MSANLSELNDFQFRDAWRDLPISEKAALSDIDRHIYIERYRALNDYVEGAGARLGRRGNGEDHDPIAEAETSVADISGPHISPANEPLPDHKPRHNYLHWAALDGLEPPPFDWLLEHWLSWHPTLLAGRGGIGKSLLVQQLGTALALGFATWCTASAPVKVLYWACEDDHDQLWRRQAKICAHYGIGMSSLRDNFRVDARYGFENTLLSTEFGRPLWTGQIELLREQVNDLKTDVLILDNLGHTFGGNENVRHDVTLFINGIAGLVQDRPFCPVFLGHPSKSANSEYSGSTAWENAVRMRWYLDDKMPDQRSESEGDPDQDFRVLAKRKFNYTRRDYVQLRFGDGVLVPEQLENSSPGLMQHLRKRKARTVILSAIRKLTAVRIFGGNQPGRNYLPHLIIENKLSEDCTKAELSEAMRAMILAQEIEMSDLGKNAARHRIYALKANIEQ